jgi:hypothetical protein
MLKGIIHLGLLPLLPLASLQTPYLDRQWLTSVLKEKFFRSLNHMDGSGCDKEFGTKLASLPGPASLAGPFIMLSRNLGSLALAGRMALVKSLRGSFPSLC